jgi:SsrA-binding protein
MARSRKEGEVACAVNRKAFRDYVVLEKFEAGIALTGTEVKSIRAGGLTLTGGYASIRDGQIVLYDVQISPYEQGNRYNHAPTRPRKLLIHKREARLLGQRVDQKGLAIIPLKVYFRRGWIKLELGLCKGRQKADKRDALRRKTADLEAARAVANSRR